MKLRREAKMLKQKAIASLRQAVVAFNSFDETGRASAVLLHYQHAFEMLLKGGLVQRGLAVFDPKTGRAIGFEKCVNLGRQHLGLTAEEAGTLRAIDAMRDDEQHWLTHTSEGLLYLHCRAGVTLFDDLLGRFFGDKLSVHLPHRVLPISAEPPRDLQLLLDEEYTQIAQLLRPGKRRRPDARARIRALLAMEGHTREEALVSKRDVDRVERAVRAGAKRSEVFPSLAEVSSVVEGEGINVVVRFTKSEGAVPVRLVQADEDVAAGAIRQVDLQRKYHWTGQQLAGRLGLTQPRFRALRLHLGIHDDDSCHHAFTFGSQTHHRYSDNALTKMRDAIAGGVDMEEVWRVHGARRGPKEPQRRSGAA